jgi:hypothetical protein
LFICLCSAGLSVVVVLVVLCFCRDRSDALRSLYGVGYNMVITRNKEVLERQKAEAAAAAAARRGARAMSTTSTAAAGTDVKIDMLPGAMAATTPMATATPAAGLPLVALGATASADAKEVSTSNADALMQLIQSRVPKAEKLSSIGAELSYRMPLDSSRVFPELFKEIDRQKQFYGVQQYNVSVTTLGTHALRTALAFLAPSFALCSTPLCRMSGAVLCTRRGGVPEGRPCRSIERQADVRPQSRAFAGTALSGSLVCVRD